MKCPRCQHENPRGTKFCEECATPLGPDAVSASKTMRHGVAQPLFLMYLGEAYFLADRVEDALALAERARSLAREGGQRSYEASALRLVGEVTAHRDTRSTLTAATVTRSHPLRSSAYAPSSSTATSASASSTDVQASASRRRSTSPPRRRCTARWG
jgi:hypothetical protein